MLETALTKFTSLYSEDPAAAEKYLGQGESPQDKRWPAKELAPYTAVASLLINLDEAVTKE
jgi:hypothetical protein